MALFPARRPQGKTTGVVTSAALALLCSGMLAGASRQDPTQQEFSKLEGAWVGVSAVQNGQQLLAEQAKALVLIFKQGSVTVRNGDRILQRATVTLHIRDRPKGMDIERLESDQRGKKLLALYELDDGALKICIAEAGTPRPKAFTTQPGSATSLFELRRERR